MNRRNMYVRLIILSFASFAGVQTAKACACDAATSACREVTSGSTVFIGTVESISPRFLDHWSCTRRPALTASPAIGLAIAASSGESQRYAISDRHGRFVFDGLATGDYTVSAWAPGYPDTLKPLSDQSEIHIGPKSCADKILLIQPR
jgi:hypothetical protein